MRVRGFLTGLVLSAALSAACPSAQAASKPRPTPTSVVKTLKAHQTCTKNAVKGARLCIRVDLKQLTNASKQKVTYMTFASYETRVATGLAISIAVKTLQGSDQVYWTGKIGIGACASVFLNADKYSEVRARLVDAKHTVLLQTSAIHLPLR